MTYEELAFKIGRLNKHGVGHAHGMGDVLSKVGYLLKGIEVGWGEPIPHIQCLVVQKTGPGTGLPDDGIKEFWLEYPKLSHLEKEVKCQAEKLRVAEYGSRWNNVLRFLRISEVRPEPKLGRVFGASGESPAHKALKDFVKSNPRFVGVDAGAISISEYALPSLDTIDVLFKTRACWTAVEVKSVVSDGVSGDYERGIYQVVKYAAILNAMRMDRRFEVPEIVSAILVLECSLPAGLSSLASDLGVKVFENVKPTKGVPNS